MNLTKLIQFLFGTPCKYDGTFKSRFMRFGYWFFVVFYAFAVVLSVISCLFNVSLIPETIIVLLVFPLFSRFVYSINLKLNGLKREE